MVRRIGIHNRNSAVARHLIRPGDPRGQVTGNLYGIAVTYTAADRQAHR